MNLVEALLAVMLSALIVVGSYEFYTDARYKANLESVTRAANEYAAMVTTYRDNTSLDDLFSLSYSRLRELTTAALRLGPLGFGTARGGGFEVGAEDRGLPRLAAVSGLRHRGAVGRGGRGTRRALRGSSTRPARRRGRHTPRRGRRA